MAMLGALALDWCILCALADSDLLKPSAVQRSSGHLSDTSRNPLRNPLSNLLDDM